ncbi:MAG: zinc ribbon domain-containing protein [Polyangiales bacterium]
MTVKPAVDFLLPPGAVRALAARIGPASLTKLSPLREEPSGAPTPPPEWLAPLIGPDGMWRPTVLPTLQVLAAPRSFARVQLLRGESLAQHSVYFSVPGVKAGADGSGRVATQLSSRGLRVIDPAPVVDTLAMLRDHLGTSSVRSTPLELEATAVEGIAFGAMIDTQRVENLQALVAGREPALVVLDPEALAKAMAAHPSSLLSVAPVLAELCAAPRLLGPEPLTVVLDSLVQRGALVRTAEGFCLTRGGVTMASSMALFGSVVTVSAVEELPHGGVVGLSFVVLSAGPTDALLLSSHGDEVFIGTVAPASVLDLITHLYVEPRPLDQLPSVRSLDEQLAPTAIAMPGVLPCRACGHPVQDSARFCHSCGTPVIRPHASWPGAGHCPRCHGVLPDGAAFCAHCGYRQR